MRVKLAEVTQGQPRSVGKAWTIVHISGTSPLRIISTSLTIVHNQDARLVDTLKSTDESIFDDPLYRVSVPEPRRWKRRALQPCLSRILQYASCGYAREKSKECPNMILSIQGRSCTELEENAVREAESQSICVKRTRAVATKAQDRERHQQNINMSKDSAHMLPVSELIEHKKWDEQKAHVVPSTLAHGSTLATSCLAASAR